MKKTRTLLPAMAFAVFMTFGVCFISTPGFAAECQIPWEPIADVYIEHDGITWVPRVSYALMELTISRPDGTIFHRAFESGETPRASLSEILGEGRLDCSYIYELRVTPSLNFQQREGDEVEVRYSQRALVQNGSFTVYQGVIVVPGEPEPGEGKSVFTSNAQNNHNLSGVRDFVINDDLIVDGSACIGFDCVNGESFGFDTLRLKENNLRIKFDDTSVAASYPRNDWQLTANDSANGGASKFSIDDISGNRTPFTVEANARSHSLYVDDGGRIGIRTSTPSLEIHVIDGDTPALRLQQDGSSGFAPQTWDVAGNETNFFIRDVTNGSQLPFRIRPDAPTNSIFIDVDGDIGLGTSSPTVPLELRRTGTAAEFIANRTDGTQAVVSAGSSNVFIGSKSDHDFRLITNDAVKMTIDTDGDVGIGTTSPSYKIEVYNSGGSNAYCDGGDWINGSSRAFKENIQAITATEAMETLKELNPVKFNYKFDKEEEKLGFIAEDVPDLVAQNDRKGMSPMDVVAVLTKVVQEQQKTISELKKEIAELKKK